MNREVYLDNNATTQALPEVVDAVADAMVEGFGNPSSVHGVGASAQNGAEREGAGGLDAQCGRAQYRVHQRCY